MKYKDFLTTIEKGKISPVFLFEGEEGFLKKQATKKLKEKLIPANEDFNFQILNATSHTSTDILEVVHQLPFQNRWQLLVVEEAEKLSTQDEKNIINYLKQPVESTCLLLVGGKFSSKKSKLYSLLKKKNRVVTFYPLTQTEALRWVNQRVKKAGKSITDEAAFELYKRVGGNLFLLQNEIAKLVSFVHPEKHITPSHVVNLAGESSKESIFDFLQVFRSKDLRSTLHLLNKLLFQGEQPLVVNRMLAREVRILLSLKLAKEKITPKQACKYIFKGRSYYSGFFVKKAKDYLRTKENFNLSELLFAQQRILQMEYSIKRGQKANLVLQKALIDILKGRES